MNLLQFWTAGFVVGWLWQVGSSVHWIISNGVVNEIRQNGNNPILPTHIPVSL